MSVSITYVQFSALQLRLAFHRPELDQIETSLVVGSQHSEVWVDPAHFCSFFMWN